MSESLQFSFHAGVLAEAFRVRPDLETYEYGLYDADNFIVDVRGGALSRAGTRYVDTLPEDLGLTVRLHRWRSNGHSSIDYLLVFGDQKLIIYWGRSRYTAVSNLMSVPAVIDTPYESEHLASLHFEQYLDDMIITSRHYPPKRLRLTNTGVFEFGDEPIGGYAGIAGGLTAVASRDSGDDNFAALYGVSAVSPDGVESPIGSYALPTDIALLTTEWISTPRAKPVVLTWDSVDGAAGYRVYRSSLVADVDTAHLGMTLGFLAETTETTYTDSGLTSPLFEYQPTGFHNPFAVGAVLGFTVRAGGSGYDATGTTVSVAGGTGFSGVPIVRDGVVVGVRIITPGQGYGTGVTIDGAGTGASLTAKVAGSYIWPSVAIRSQQRRIYAGTINKPNSLFASAVGAPQTFYKPRVPHAATSFELELDAPQQNTIRALAGVPSGLLVFTSEEVWRIYNGLSPETARAEPLNMEGASELTPLSIRGSLLYVEEGSQGVQRIYQDAAQGVYVSQSVSDQSNHLFSSENPIVSWAYAKVPHGLVWAVRKDGSMLSFTYGPERGIFAWMPHTTQGYFRSVAVLEEQNNTTRVYVVVERAGKLYLEILEESAEETEEDLWGIDNGVAILGNYYSPALVPLIVDNDAQTLTTEFDWSSLPATVAGTQYHVRWGKRGRALITMEYSSGGSVFRSVDDWIADEIKLPQSDENAPITHWQIRRLRKTFTPPAHLQNRAVHILTDGTDEFGGPVTLGEGAFTLPVPASRIHVGLPFEGFVETLPIREVETPEGRFLVGPGRQSQITGAIASVIRSRGLFVATGDDPPRQVRPRTTEPMGTPPKFLDGHFPMYTTPNPVGVDGRIKLVKRGPGQVGLVGLAVTVNSDPTQVARVRGR